MVRIGAIRLGSEQILASLERPPPAMEEPDPVVCFQHCEKGVNIVYLEMPALCPLCGQETGATRSELPPFRLPSPFTAAVTAPYSVVVRPTDGTFLR